MNCIFVLNAFSRHFLRHTQELYAFLNTLENRINLKKAVIIGPPDLGNDIISHIAAPKLIILESAAYDPEGILAELPQHCGDCDVVIFPASCYGDELAPRLAARLKGAASLGVTSLGSENGAVSCDKYVFSRHLEARFCAALKPFCLSLAPCCAPGLDMAPPASQPDEIIRLALPSQQGPVIWSQPIPDETNDNKLAEAKLILAGGLGLGSRENFMKLEKLAALLGAETGASRLAAMNAWAPLEKLLGVSGVMSRGEICLIFGASGAPAFYAGVEKCRFIIAVNRDQAAPAAAGADVFVEEDAALIIEELINICSNDA